MEKLLILLVKFDRENISNINIITNIDLIYCGVNSITLYKLRYYGINVNVACNIQVSTIDTISGSSAGC